MSNQYTSVSVADYNTNPPSDDGAQTTANSVTWAKHKTKLADPIKTALESINTNITAAFLTNFGGVTTTKTSTYTVVAADRGKLFSVTNETTITALDAATAGDGFVNTVINSDASAVVTVTGSGAETISGADNIFLYPGESISWVCDGTNNLIISDGRDKTPAGTIVYGLFTTADPGYILCTGGTIGSAASGADTAKAYTETLYDKAKVYSPNAGTEVFGDDDTVTLPDMRGRVAAGNDDLGGASANTVTAANADVEGGLVGTETQAAAGSIGTSGSTTLTASQIPTITSSLTPGNNTGTNDGGSYTYLGASNIGGIATTTSTTVGGISSNNTSGSSHSHSGGSFTGSATNIVQPTYFCGAQVKL